MFLRLVSRPLLAKFKEATGIVGLDVVPNAREVLIGLYNKTLKEIQAVPEDEGYRKAVESFTRHRLKVCQEEEDWEMIEKRLGCGQVEELIEEARDELTLVGKMIEWVPWGVPMTTDATLLKMMLQFPSTYLNTVPVLYQRSSTRRSKLFPRRMSLKSPLGSHR